MSSLLYYSISSNLTKDETIEIDRQVANNRETVCIFVRNLASNAKGKAKKTVLGTTFWMGTAQRSEAMGLSIPPRSTPVGRVQPSYQQPAELKIASIFYKRLDKICLIPTKEMIPLIYLNAQNVYLNEKVLRKLRAGNLSGMLLV